MSPFLGEEQAKAFLKLDPDAGDSGGDSSDSGHYHRQQRRHEFWGKRSDLGDSSSGLLRMPSAPAPANVAEGDETLSDPSKRSRYDFIGKRGSMLFVQRSYNLNHGQKESPLALLRKALYAPSHGAIHTVNSRARHDFVGKRRNPELSSFRPNGQFDNNYPGVNALAPGGRWLSEFYPHDIRPDLAISKLTNALKRKAAALQGDDEAYLKRDLERYIDGKRTLWPAQRHSPLEYPSNGYSSRPKPNFRFAMPVPKVLQRMFLSRAYNDRVRQTLI